MALASSVYVPKIHCDHNILVVISEKNQKYKLKYFVH